MGKTPLGKLEPSAIGMSEVPRLKPSVLESFRALVVLGVAGISSMGGVGATVDGAVRDVDHSPAACRSATLSGCRAE